MKNRAPANRLLPTFRHIRFCGISQPMIVGSTLPLTDGHWQEDFSVYIVMPGKKKGKKKGKGKASAKASDTEDGENNSEPSEKEVLLKKE